MPSGADSKLPVSPLSFRIRYIASLTIQVSSTKPYSVELEPSETSQEDKNVTPTGPSVRFPGVTARDLEI